MKFGALENGLKQLIYAQRGGGAGGEK